MRGRLVGSPKNGHTIVASPGFDVEFPGGSIHPIRVPPRQPPSRLHPEPVPTLSRGRFLRLLTRAAGGTAALGWLTALGAPTASGAKVQPGIDTLTNAQFSLLRGKRVGLFTNPSGANRQGVPTVDVLRRAPGVRLTALFAPEHGIRGEIAAGLEFPDAVDPATGIPVFSLYGRGPTRRPTPRMLQTIDVLLYDIQDVGTRSYTFVSSMGLAMEACAEAGVEFMVLDRPNPLGGVRVEGPGLDPSYRSLVSQWDVPYVYGMTAGELARMINGEHWIKKVCRLNVVPVQGWKRAMTWRETGLPWLPTSPKITTIEAAFGYPALGLCGEVAKGSGLTTGNIFNRPFEWVAASWLDGTQACAYLNEYGLKGVTFTPTRVERDGRAYSVIRSEFRDAARAPLVAINFYVLEVVRRMTGRNLAREWSAQNPPPNLFDKVAGGLQLRRDLEAGRSAANIVRSWKQNEDAFRRRRAPYLIYS